MLHIIQNDPEVPPGLIAEELSSAEVSFRLIHPYLGEPLPEPAEIEGMICLGGAMGANDDEKHPFLGDLKGLIRRVVQEEIPYLGVCLGGQLLASALGVPVRSGRFGEKGTLTVALTGEGSRDRLFRGIGEEFVTFQWHDDSFDLPEGGVLLASSPACPHQAFRVGPCAWGTQFHPEVDEAIIRDWCSWSAGTAAMTEQMVDDYRATIPEYRRVARQMMINFLDAAGIRAATGT